MLYCIGSIINKKDNKENTLQAKSENSTIQVRVFCGFHEDCRVKKTGCLPGLPSGRISTKKFTNKQKQTNIQTSKQKTNRNLPGELPAHRPLVGSRPLLLHLPRSSPLKTRPPEPPVLRPVIFTIKSFFHLFLLDVYEGKNSDYDKMCETVPKQNVSNKNLFDLDVLV